MILLTHKKMLLPKTSIQQRGWKAVMSKKKLLQTVSIIPILLTTLILTHPHPTKAEDLPIDITAIDRQTARDNQPATRIAANLFSEDAQQVNEALAHQIQQIQAAAAYLFTSPPATQETDPQTQLQTAAHNAALFTQPVTTPRFTQPQQPSAQIPIWIAAPIITACAAAGFIWALTSAKKGRTG